MAPSPSSSSAKKVAKLAQRGKGKKVRFQGGTLFPAVVLIVLVLGLVTIFYARQSRPDAGSSPPQVNDHWHAAYGMYVCDTWLPKLVGTQEETLTDSQGNRTYVNDLFGTTGVHSHDDGVIHYHPYSTKSVGRRAKLGVFLDVYGVKLTDTELKLPEVDGGADYDTDDFKCGGKDTEVKVVVWNSYTDTGKGTTYITDFPSIRILNDGMVFSIAVVEKGKEVAMPPWAKKLPELGAADSNTGAPATTIEGDTTPTTATDGSTPDTATDGTSTEATGPADTSSDDTVATATTGG